MWSLFPILKYCNILTDNLYLKFKTAKEDDENNNFQNPKTNTNDNKHSNIIWKTIFNKKKDTCIWF